VAPPPPNSVRLETSPGLAGFARERAGAAPRGRAGGVPPIARRGSGGAGERGTQGGADQWGGEAAQGGAGRAARCAPGPPGRLPASGRVQAAWPRASVCKPPPLLYFLFSALARGFNVRSD
jgi:hypothetical protein